MKPLVPASGSLETALEGLFLREYSSHLLLLTPHPSGGREETTLFML